MRSGRDVLRTPEALRALCAAVAGVSRLVLLGDVVELRQAPLQDALAAARAPLRALGAALAPGTEVVIVPGNHDHRLLAPWRARRDRRRPLGTESDVDWREGEPLHELAWWLSPGRLRVAYPGTWLAPDVYAIHGHYADRHTTVPMLERLGAGLTARVAGEDSHGPSRAEDYEAALGPMYALLEALADTGGRGATAPSAAAWRLLAGTQRPGLRGRALGAAFPLVVAALNRAGLGPLSADLTGPGMRRGRLNAVGEFVARLRLGARHVVVGHTHRAGPLGDDDRAEWIAADGTRLVNCGCWVRETAFEGRGAAEPYRPGFAVALGGGGVAADTPRLVNLLGEAGGEADAVAAHPG